MQIHKLEKDKKNDKMDLITIINFFKCSENGNARNIIVGNI